MSVRMDDGSFIIRVPAPPPCLPDPDSFDDLFVRMQRLLPYGWSFEALHGSHSTYNWIAIISHREPGTGGHGNPGELTPPIVGIGAQPIEALRDVVAKAETAIKDADL